MMRFRVQLLTLKLLIVTLLATICGDVLIGEAQANLSLEATFAHEGVCVLEFSPDGSQLAVRSSEGIHLYQTGALSDSPVFIPGQFGCQLVFTPDGQHIVVAAGTTVQLLNIQSGDVIRTYEGHRASITSLTLSPDGTQLASSGRDYRTVIWDVETGEYLFSFEQDEIGEAIIYPAMSLAFAPDGTQLAAATRHTIHVWDTQTGEWLAKLSGGVSPGLVQFSSDGARLLMASTVNAHFILWDTGTWEVVAEGLLDSSQQGIAFSPDGQFLALGTSGDSDTPSSGVQIWDAITGQPVDVLLLGEAGPLSSLAYSPDGSILAVGCHDGRLLMLWDATTGGTLDSYEAHSGRIGDIRFSPDVVWLVTVGYDDLVQVWTW
jgi:WD40 repeat protein